MTDRDTNYIFDEQASDHRVRVNASPDNPEFISVQIDADAGVFTMRLAIDDAKKLATRIWAAAKLARGELQLNDPRHAN